MGQGQCCTFAQRVGTGDDGGLPSTAIDLPYGETDCKSRGEHSKAYSNQLILSNLYPLPGLVLSIPLIPGVCHTDGEVC